MYPSSTIHLSRACNSKDDDDDDDLSTLSGSTATNLFRSELKLDNNTKSYQERRLNNYLARQKYKAMAHSKRVASAESRPFDEVEDQDVEIPFDEDTQGQRRVDYCAIIKQDPNFISIDRKNNNDDDDADDSSAESYCKRWEIQADGNLEPIMSLIPLPPRQNRFEKSRKSAFVSTDKTRSYHMSSGGNNASAKVDISRRRNRLEKIKQRQGGKLLAASSRHLNKGIEPKAKSDYVPKTPTKEKQVTESDNSSSSDNDLTTHTSNIKKGVELDKETGGFQSGLSKLKLKLNAAQSVLGTQSEILSEVSRKYKTDDISERRSLRIMEKTKRLQNSLPPLSPLNGNSIKTTPNNLNTSLTTPSKAAAPTSPGSSFTISTRTTECTSTTSSAKHEQYVYMLKDSIQKLDYPSPKSPNDEIDEEILSPNNTSFDEVSSPPGLIRRPNFPKISDSSDESHGERSEREGEFVLGTTSPHDQDEMKYGQTQHVVNNWRKKFESYSSIDAPNERNEIQKAHKVTMSVEISGDSLLKLKEIIGKMRHDIRKYEDEEESISIATSCDNNFFKTMERKVKAIGGPFETRLNSDQASRAPRLLASSSQSIVKEMRTAINEATF